MRPCNLATWSRRAGITLVEILIVVVIAVLLIGTLTTLFSGFRRSFAKGEESTVVIQEGGFFLAHLRNDLINAVLPPGFDQADWQKAIVADADSLSFSLYADAQGTIETVTYMTDGKSLKRMVKNGSPKPLIEGRIASLSWKTGWEVIPTPGSGTRRLWVELSATLGGQGKPGMTSKQLHLRTRLFPARLNRQLNGNLSP
ncbi:MAG TPA: prepilin-type N-terminal cleavage/methylation domain-containing protein [Candidatus Ozemobacteraceae bacterium]|nr:prepilin-type N-terminal cleavage/methylation domain-containing protein [Candidatus Ozemobacteraceae bacterium]